MKLIKSNNTSPDYRFGFNGMLRDEDVRAVFYTNDGAELYNVGDNDKFIEKGD